MANDPVYTTLAGYLSAIETHGATAADIPTLIDKLQETAAALDELVKLYGHYARLLNRHDGGERRTFTSGEEWLRRFREVNRGG